MYAYINGKVKKINNDSLILECHHIGYKIIAPNPYLYELGEETTIYTYFYVREDAQELYGFKSENEKDLFERLISVTGIGPKSACAILASGDVGNVVNAIEQGDVTYLTKFPKVGPKTAQQIILDLKGKLKPVEEESTDTRPNNHAMDEAIEALKALGYKEREIGRVMNRIRGKQLSTQEYITTALQLMLK